MGFLSNLKKGAKSYVDAYNKSDFKKNRDAQKKYNTEVASAVKQAQREAYKKEAIKQAKLKAKISAKQKYNPKVSKSGSGGMSAEASALIYGTPQKKKKKNAKDDINKLLYGM